MNRFSNVLSVFLTATLLASFGCGGHATESPPTTPKEEKSIAVASAAPSEKPPSEKPKDEPVAPASKPGPAGFPLPMDAEGAGPVGGGGGKITTYKVLRARDVVVAEVKMLAQKAGWTLDADDTSPKGAARMTFSKSGATVKVSIVGDAEKSGLILTAP